MSDRSSQKRKIQAQTATTRRNDRTEPAQETLQSPLVRAAAELGVTMRLRKRQKLAVHVDGAETLYVLRSGVMMVEAGRADDPQVVFGLLYPDDAYRSSYLPPVSGGRIMALTRCEVLRVRWNAFAELIRSDDSLLDAYQTGAASLYARLALHTAILSTLSGEERVVSLLIELADRLGQRNGESISCELPMLRTDMAAYLALNADTLSRIMSRLKADGIITSLGRGQLIVPEAKRLFDRSPLSHAVSALIDPMGKAAA